jgi:NAD(P)H dehydrogenase (quinone)
MISVATRQDYAVAAATALRQDDEGNRTYELGGPAFDLAELARVISDVTGTSVTYRDLPAEDYVSWLQETGLDEGSARFVAALTLAGAEPVAGAQHGSVRGSHGDHGVGR